MLVMGKEHENYLNEWKENHDTFKYHEDLKQKRFSYFITVQTAFIALTALLARLLFNDDEPYWITLCLVCILGKALVDVFSKLDSRGRDYVDVIKGKLIAIEKDWKKSNPDKAFTTYIEQFEILVHKNKALATKYIDARGIGESDRIFSIVNETGNSAAHVQETNIFSLFSKMWLLVYILSISAHFYQMI